MNFKNKLIFSVVSGVFFASFSMADALQPDEAMITESFNKAEWVSTLKIEGVRSLVNQAMSQTKPYVAIQGYRYSASVLKDWKGSHTVDDTVKFRVDLTDCMDQLELDGEYVVFGTSNYRNSLQVFSCKDLISIEAMQPLMSPLTELSNSHRENTK
ncbi:hypothetical protein NBRC116493_18880 [Aurantivibrio infirmus]